MESARKPLVLYVDDSPDSLALIRRWLEGGGYEVVTSSSAQAGLDLLESITPDLILLDVLMPDMNGYEFCAKFHSQKAASLAPVVFLTALFTRQDKARALAAGAVDFLVKPVRQERLLETVKKHLATHAQWDQLGARKGMAPDLRGFLDYLQNKLNLAPELAKSLDAITAETLYSLASVLAINETLVSQFIAQYLGFPHLIQIDHATVALGVLPPAFCKARHVIPINEGNERGFVVSNPFLPKLIEDISSLHTSAQKPRIFVTEPANIAELFVPPPEDKLVSITAMADPGTQTPQGHLEAASMLEIEAKLSGIFQIEAETVADAAVSEESAPIILLVNRIIDDACKMGASDIHIEPREMEVIVRYRIDGDLREMRKLQPQKLILPIVARIKIMSNLAITERRLPQDGRIVYKDGIDLRVATVPTNFGEKVVMRLLDKKKSAQPLDALGFSERNLALYRARMQTPYGMILHVGPTGSGKSMTLFAALKELQTPEINIQTIEDPIEYTLPGISQVQVNQVVGLTFARGLRSFLRQDPDVILVGEIRDRETADVAVEAALTGHLMLSTLHTNDSAATVTRLIEMGIEPYLVSSSIIMICAQRLLRRLCPKCKRAVFANEDEKRLAGVPAGVELKLFAAGSCPACGGQGYKGRIGVHEILVMDDSLRAAMSRHGITADELKRQAVEKSGMSTLYWDGVDKARSGITSIKEVVSQIRQDDFDSQPAWMRVTNIQ